MKIISFGGFVKAADVPKPFKNTESQILIGQILEKLKECPKGESISYKVEDFGKFERYATQSRLQKRGAHVECRVNGQRDKDGNIKSGTLFIIHMTDEQWARYMARPGSPVKKAASAKK